MPAAITFNPNVNYGTIQDNENNTYKTVTIGSQIWMAENLKVTHFNNGDPIPKLSTSGENVILENSSAYTYYDYENGYKDIYGALYNGYVVTDSRGVCPTNWHIANGGDWETLFNDNNVVRLKENSSNYWWVNTQSSNTNSTGFTAIPAGILTNSSFQYLNYSSDWWSSSTNQNSKLMNFYIDVTNSFYKIEDTKEKMFSIRCIKD